MYVRKTGDCFRGQNTTLAEEGEATEFVYKIMDRKPGKGKLNQECSDWFLLENRKPDLGDVERQAQRYVTASLADGSVLVAEKTGAGNQRWSWQDGSFLVNCATGSKLTYDDVTKSVTITAAGSVWSYGSDGLLRDQASGKAAYMKLRKTEVSMTKNVPYLKDDDGNQTDTPWLTYLWNIVHV